ncbi:YjgF/Yer057c/UK114 family protein [Pandoravirus neocaledonia]|uniref:YjgF/Yer057c/UK114 family protein n=1 Tax=Pandoravirus neocaledonia TaxID=2107708 RepID=A0A2U7UBP2_9VIRU|nr:YjgF/Yer057c/UK114 family protein [Pandoravirus neocaledonia]AVK75775.1 YjgF/Yer057c/UK114 family protein [Pandoravirus neocaledonia]
MQRIAATHRPTRAKAPASPGPTDPCSGPSPRRRVRGARSPPSQREPCHAIVTPSFARADVEQYGFAQVVRCRDTVWVSGTVANGPDGRLVRGGIRRQTRQVFDNLNRSLKAAGCRGLEDIVDLTAAIVDARHNAAGFVAVRSKCMPRGTFTSMATGVTALLVPGALVEIKCTAVVDRSHAPRT